MDRSSERTALAAAVLALAAAVADASTRAAGGALALAPLAVLCAWAGATALVAFVRFHLERREAEEQRDEGIATTERAESSLFVQGDADGEPFSHARSRRIVERRMIPLVAPLVGVVLGFAAWRLGRFDALPGTPAPGLTTAAALALQSFVLFMVGRLLIGLARDPARRLLAGPGAALGLASLASAIASAAVAAAHGAWAGSDAAAAGFLALACALLAAESLVRALLHLYRPRRTADRCFSYESALARRLVDPASWMQGAADTLDYQFGFKLSQTWLYRFLAGALAPLIVFQAAILYGSTCLVFLQPDEDAVIERLGRPRAESDGGWHLGPGAHLKRPWPFETVRRFPARRILTLDIGYKADGRPAPDAVLWTRPHFVQEDSFLVAGRESAGLLSTGTTATTAAPVNMVSFNVPVEYRITNLLQYAYHHADPATAIRQAAYRALTREAAGRDLFEMLGGERQAMAVALRSRIAADADQLGLGVEIVFVGIPGIHPPVAVAPSFESVIGAGEEREARILEGRAYAARSAPSAAAEAARTAFEAAAYRDRRSLLATAETAQFLARKTAYDRSPVVYRKRAQLQAILDGLMNTRLYVVAATPDWEVLQFNFEEKPSAGLFDLGQKAEQGTK